MIKLFTTVDEFTSYKDSLSDKSIGLVPTMGNLHEGHLSLINESSKENDITVVTIFVNPLQFGPNEDFDKYPRTLEQDIQRIETLGIAKDILVLAPSNPKEIYPQGYNTTISVSGISEGLCGSSRPGHFDGVTTVVYRLFKITSPNTAYFGQKDYQQQLVIKKMTADLDLNIQIKTMPIIREESGLAKSSRNQYLSTEQVEQALELNSTLTIISDILTNQTYLDASIELNGVLEKKISDLRWEYLEILDSDTLQEINPATNYAVILGALKIGETRLIDNQVIKIQYAR